ncbi:SdpI family protein [Flavobacterium sp.]|uniref:SdpI family protein n=1 Tax=Flavobacterium sp. TaxID=239 RepID=UPI00391C7C3D
MNIIIIILLVFAILIKIFPPKKPNFYYGYQLGSAKNSEAHWKLANQYAANYLILLYSFLLFLSVILHYFQYDAGIIVLSILVIGQIFIYYSIERKLKTQL